jgi:hypothetical protein
VPRIQPRRKRVQRSGPTRSNGVSAFGFAKRLKPLCEELEAALGAKKSAGVGEAGQGYRRGARECALTPSLGPTTIAMPRARLVQADGTRRQWHSQTVRRSERRTTRVDEAILGVYLAGNTRRINGALAPLPRGGPLSKDAVSRLVGRLREDFETWRTRDLADEDICYVSNGRLISDGPDWPTPRTHAGAGDVGGAGQRRPRGTRYAAGCGRRTRPSGLTRNFAGARRRR